MSGVSVQVGPRSVGRCCAGWGHAIARNRFVVGLAFAGAVFEAVLVVVMLMLSHTAHHGSSVPAIFTSAPTVFCPAGQHVTGISASGWPDCAPGH
jgi:hypothetical protein